MLFDAEVVTATEEQPASLSEHNIAALPLQTSGFLGTNLIERLVHVGDDMEAVKDMQRFRAVVADKFKMASSPFETEWRGAHYAEESAGHVFLRVPGWFLPCDNFGVQVRASRATSASLPRVSSVEVWRIGRPHPPFPEPCVWLQHWLVRRYWSCRGFHVQASYGSLSRPPLP